MFFKSYSDPDKKDRWLPLDNAAKIFPAGAGEERSLVYRLMVELDRPVSYHTLVEALNRTIGDLPYFTCRLRRGFFWYYFEPDPSGLEVLPDVNLPCRAFHFRSNQMDQLRVLLRDNRISCEFFHALTDGSGALEFVRTLIEHYAALAEDPAAAWEEDSYYDELYDELTEDSYNKYFNPRVPIPDKLRKAYHLPFPFRAKPRLRILSAEVPSDQVKAYSKSIGISVTEYLASVYMSVLQEIYHQVQPQGRPDKHSVIRIQVPVNLRKLFPSKTLRNFSLFVVPEIDTSLGSYTFEEIVKNVRFFMQHETEAKQMQRTIYRNVRNEKSYFIRLVPLLLKNLILAYHFRKLGMSLYSGLITNLGVVRYSDRASRMVQRLRFLPPPPDQSRVSLAVVTYEEKMVITFANSTRSRLLERKFTQHLRQHGIDVKLLNS
ncbi:MAG: hypothetical protein R6V75_09715 [Bacteroidales bacterium]